MSQLGLNNIICTNTKYSVNRNVKVYFTSSRNVVKRRKSKPSDSLHGDGIKSYLTNQMLCIMIRSTIFTCTKANLYILQKCPANYLYSSVLEGTSLR